MIIRCQTKRSPTTDAYNPLPDVEDWLVVGKTVGIKVGEKVDFHEGVAVREETITAAPEKVGVSTLIAWALLLNDTEQFLQLKMACEIEFVALSVTLELASITFVEDTAMLVLEYPNDSMAKINE